MEKFTVLMSVYYKEVASFFDMSLRSILINQSLKPNEFVLVCDGDLTTELEDVLQKYCAMFPDVLRLYRKENGGLGKALNYGLEKCTYSLVARADSDDICVEDRFEKQVAFMEQHPEFVVSSGSISEFVDDPSSILRTKRNPTTAKGAYKKAKTSNPLNHMAVMFRKDIIIEMGSYHNVPLLEDYDLWTRLLIAGYQVCNMEDVLVYARVGNGMAKRRSSVVQIDGWMKISKNMLNHRMINLFEYCRNYVLITGFVFLPVWLKNIVYSRLLRNR